MLKLCQNTDIKYVTFFFSGEMQIGNLHPKRGILSLPEHWSSKIKPFVNLLFTFCGVTDGSHLQVRVDFKTYSAPYLWLYTCFFVVLFFHKSRGPKWHSYVIFQMRRQCIFIYGPFLCVSKVTGHGKEIHLHLTSCCVISIFVTSSFCHHFGTVTSFFFFLQNLKIVLQLLKSDYNGYVVMLIWTMGDINTCCRKYSIYDSLVIHGIQQKSNEAA